MMFSILVIVICLTSSFADETSKFSKNLNEVPGKIAHKGVPHITNSNWNFRFKTSNEENAVEAPLKIGSFNIQTLTPKKFERPNVMSVVEKVILRYDLILVMEIMLKNDYYLQKLLTVINRLAPSGVVYNVTRGSEHPTTKELNAFFYRIDKLKLVNIENYQNADEQFYRKPTIVRFKSLTLRDMKEFIVVGHHVKPNAAIREMNALANLYDYIKKSYILEDVLLMGDFNADCSYVREEEWENITLWMRPEFTWAIKTHIDTTTNHRSCALDRFVYAGNGMNKGVILSSAQPFNFQEAYGLTLSETRNISDHWPIEIQIRGKLSSEAENHLASNVCVSVSDNRQVVKIEKLEFLAKAAGFSVYKTGNSKNFLNRELPSTNTAIEALKNLHRALPGILTKELLQGSIYKVTHGGLLDGSSYADNTKTVFSVTIITDKNSTVIVCRSTTIN